MESGCRLEECRLVSGFLDTLAAKYPTTKFVSIVGNKVRNLAVAMSRFFTSFLRSVFRTTLTRISRRSLSIAMETYIDRLSV